VELAAYLNETPKTNATFKVSTNDPTVGMLQYPPILVFTEENGDIPKMLSPNWCNKN